MELTDDMIKQIQEQYEKDNCCCIDKKFPSHVTKNRNDFLKKETDIVLIMLTQQEYIEKLQQENKYLKEQIEDIKTILEIINQ
jgi:hypothetical protein